MTFDDGCTEGEQSTEKEGYRSTHAYLLHS